MEASIFSVINVLDALSYISGQSGKQFHPEVVRAFLDMMS
jgi:hypothetical protein